MAIITGKFEVSEEFVEEPKPPARDFSASEEKDWDQVIVMFDTLIVVMWSQ